MSIDPVVISCFIPCEGDGGYFERHGELLAEECSSLDVTYCIEERPPLGGWRANQHWKPRFIEEMIVLWDQPVLWLDVDLKLTVKPQLPNKFAQCDWAGYHYRGSELDNNKLERNGTRDCVHFVNPTSASRYCLERWRYHCDLSPTAGDHGAWGRAFHESVASGLIHFDLRTSLDIFHERPIDIPHLPRKKSETE